MKVEEQIRINGTKAAVWATIIDIPNAASILTGIEKIELLNEIEKGGIGLKWRETRMYFGKPSSIDKWITDAKEHSYYTTRAEMDGFTFITTLSISEKDDTTLLTSTHITQANGILAQLKALPMVFFKGMLKKAILTDLNDFKKAVESL